MSRNAFVKSRPVFLFALLLAAGQERGSDEPVHLDLTVADLESVRWAVDEAQVQLRPAATGRLAAVTSENVGRLLEVTIDGHLAFRAYAMGAITSGSMGVKHPSPELMLLLSGVKPPAPPPRQPLVFDPSAAPLTPAVFDGIDATWTLGEILARLGPASAITGSGLMILVWHVTDGRLFLVGLADGGSDLNRKPVYAEFKAPQ
jgi:hypothetical protein